MNNVSVRPARPDELDAVARLRWRWHQEVNETPASTQEEFVPRFVAWAKQNEATHQCTVLVRDDTVIGMAWLATVRRVPHPRSLDRMSGDLQCVYVVPDERDAGLGGLLIDAVLTRARDLGLKRVTVHSSDRAVSAYSRRGFVVSPQLLQVDFASTS